MNSKQCHYRPYQPIDASELSNLVTDFLNCLKELEPEKRMKLEHGFGQKYLNLLLQDIEENDGAIVICSHDQRMVGFSACLVIVPSPYDEIEYVNERIGRITELYVVPEYSGHGIGSNLIHTMENILRSKGCIRVEMGVNQWNTKAHALYRRLGYADQFVRLAKPL